MRTNETTVGDVLVLRLEGQLTYGNEGQTLASVVRRALEGGTRKFLVNFTAVPLMDSVGLGTLVEAYTSITRQEGDLCLTGLNARITSLLQMSKLLSVFQVKDTEEAYLSRHSHAPEV